MMDLAMRQQDQIHFRPHLVVGQKLLVRYRYYRLFLDLNQLVDSKQGLVHLVIVPENLRMWCQ